MARTATTLLILNFLSCSQLFAWSGAGHMVIPAEVYRELSPELKSVSNEVGIV